MNNAAPCFAEVRMLMCACMNETGDASSLQEAATTDAVSPAWLVFVYRVPTEPSSTRVAIWRDLKRMGALYLQQCVCVLPDRTSLREELRAVRARVAGAGGASNLFEVPRLAPEEEASLIRGFRELSAQQYAEIVEECESKFVKEIEFEHFRENYTFAEAEEIEQDLEKIRRWHARVQARDWFGAPGGDEVEEQLRHCAELFDEFLTVVHTRSAGQVDEHAEDAGPEAHPRIFQRRRPSSGR
jgi:hypothetical protein